MKVLEQGSADFCVLSVEVDEAVAAAEKEGQKQDGTRGRGAGGHIGIALKEEQEKTLHAAV